MGTNARSALRGGATAILSAAAFAFGALGSGAAFAQAPGYFTGAGTCSGCHGNPAQISSDGRALTTIGVSSATPVGSGTDWLRNDAAFADHLDNFGVGPMNSLAGEGALGTSANRDPVRAYLQRLRDGQISQTSLGFASTNIGGSRNLTFTLTNDRFLAATFSVSKSGTDSADFTVTGCGSTARQQWLRSRLRSGRRRQLHRERRVQPRCRHRHVAQRQPFGRLFRQRRRQSGRPHGHPQRAGSGRQLQLHPGRDHTTARFDLGQSSDVNVGTIANNGQATLQITSILPQAPAPVGGSYTRITSPGGSCGATPFNLGAGAVLHGLDPLHAERGRGQLRHLPHHAEPRRGRELHADRNRHPAVDQSDRVGPGLRQRPAGRFQAAHPGGHATPAPPRSASRSVPRRRRRRPAQRLPTTRSPAIASSGRRCRRPAAPAR